jgi:3-keto-5-aminohexanoate cleavage enzyme
MGAVRFGVLESACVLTAAGLGGHVRVGFENNLWLADGSLAESNADLVTQARKALPLLGCRPANIEATRALLAETAT